MMHKSRKIKENEAPLASYPTLIYIIFPRREFNTKNNSKVQISKITKSAKTQKAQFKHVKKEG